MRLGETPVLDCTPQAVDEKRTLETFTPEPTPSTCTPEATSKTLTEEAPAAPDDSTDEDCWVHALPRMQGVKMSMPPNTFTRFIRLRSTSSDSSHSTCDIDEKSGVPSAMFEALDRLEPLDPHLLAPRRRVLKRPAAHISRDIFKDRRACPHVLCCHLCRRLDKCLTTEKDDVAAVCGRQAREGGAG